MIKYFQCVFLFVSLLFSSSYGQQFNWKLVNSPSGLKINELTADLRTSTTVASTVNGVYLSSDNGKSWAHKGADVKALRNNINCAAIHGDTIVVGLDGDTYYSIDAGNTWTNDRPSTEPSTLQGAIVLSMVFLGDGSLIAGTSDGIFQSTDLGVIWTQSDLSSILIRKLCQANRFLFAITQDGLYSSIDAGNSWSKRSKNAQDSLLISDSVLTDIRFSAADSTLYLFSENRGLHRSTTWGATWELVSNQNSFSGYALRQLLITTSVSGIILRSIDSGHTWNPVHTGFSTSNFTALGNTMLFGDNNGVWRSTDQGNTWLFNNEGLNSVTDAFLATPSGLIALTSSGIQRSADNGQTWQNTHATPSATLGLVQSDNNYYASTQDTIFYSTDEGVSWAAIGNKISAGIVFYDIAIDRDTFFSIGFDYNAQQYAIYKSTNKGKKWSNAGLSLDNDDPSQILAFHDTIYVLGIANSFGSTSHIYRTINSGIDWKTIPVNNDGVFSLIPYKGRIFAGTDDGVYPIEGDTIGNGLSPHSLLAVRFFDDGKSLFATTPQGVYMYQDSGTLWRNLGPQNQDMTVISGKEGKLFAFTRTGDLYLADETSSVSKQESVSSAFSIFLNAIHPTSIEFNVLSSISGQLDLRLYDDLGRLQGESIHTEITVGNQRIVFPTATLRSSVYFYIGLLRNEVCSGRILFVK